MLNHLRLAFYEQKSSESYHIAVLDLFPSQLLIHHRLYTSIRLINRHEGLNKFGTVRLERKIEVGHLGMSRHAPYQRPTI